MSKTLIGSLAVSALMLPFVSFGSSVPTVLSSHFIPAPRVVATVRTVPTIVIKPAVKQLPPAPVVINPIKTIPSTAYTPSPNEISTQVLVGPSNKTLSAGDQATMGLTILNVSDHTVTVNTTAYLYAYCGVNANPQSVSVPVSPRFDLPSGQTVTLTTASPQNYYSWAEPFVVPNFPALGCNPSGNTVTLFTTTTDSGVVVGSRSYNFQISPPPPPSPRINYVQQTAGAVIMNYFDLPANTQVLLFNQTSGASYANTSPISGTGSLAVPIDPSLPSGAYYLRAQNASTREYLSQSVVFYIDHSAPSDVQL